jgi:thiol-disulfide isomerase/thioredoxin
MRLLGILLLTLSLGVHAQTASNFNIDDIDGINRDLFTELDNGNVIVLKFFTNWCGICNNTADEVVAIYNGYQTNGDPVVFWALDRDPNETNAHATTYRNNNSIPFPVIGEAFAVATQFGVQYQPEYYIIRPDRSYVMRTNYTAMQAAVDDALASIATGIADFASDVKVLIAGNTLLWNEESSSSAQLKVVDMRGRMVLDQKVKGKEEILLNLPAGVYVFELITPDGKRAVGKLGLAD